MKTLLCLISLALTNVASLSAAEPVADVFREGLFEEEANRNLPAAIQAYEQVVQRLDEQRRLAATAIFRLGECYRKLGRIDDAVAAYERVLREFSGEDTLAKLSRENLSLLRPPAPAALSSPTSLPSLSAEIARNEQRTLLLQEIALVEQALVAEERRVSAGAGPRSDLLPLQRDLLSLKRELARLDSVISTDLYNPDQLQKAANSATTDPESVQEEIKLVEDQLSALQARSTDRASTGAELLPLQRDLLRLQRQLPESAQADHQTALIEEEMALVEKVVQNKRILVESGRAAPADVLQLERDLLGLQRQLSAAQSIPAAIVPTSTSPTPATSEEADEIRRIQALVANSPDLINAPGDGGMTELTVAARNGRLSVVSYLLDHGARVDAARVGGQTALHQAVAEGHLKVAELLLERGASVDAATTSGRTPLFEAAQKGYRELAKLLLSKGAEVNATMTSTEKPPGAVFGGTPLWTAVANQQTAMAELLLSHGADPNLTGGDAGTPLSAADTPELVRLLLDNGADPKRGRGQTVGEGGAEE